MKRIVSFLGGALAAVMLLANAAQAQTLVTYNFVPTNAQNWNVDANWNDPISGFSFVPDGSMFDERAYINNGPIAGNGGTAFVNSMDVPPPGAVFVQHGTAEIRSGGTLNVIQSINGLWDGSVTINGAGLRANLNVLPGGTLTTQGLLSSGANALNTITFGGTAAGTATINVPSAIFRGATRVFPNAAFTSTGSVTFNAGTYTAEINGTSSPVLNIGQNAILGGTLRASFTGAAPAVGGAWPILQANSVINNFGAITSTLTLPVNQRLMTRVVAIANNRQRLDLELAEILVLNVNRDSGAVSITQPGTSGIGLDVYTVASSQGRLVAGSWNSVTDQGLLGGGWNESTAGPGSISEQRPSGVGTAAGGSSISLGPIYNALGGTFAAAVNDVSFQYSDSAGRIVDGIVNYTGTKVNNILLHVDPTTGNAKLRNTSNTTVNIDGYVITSGTQATPGTSLTPGTWNSLDDQNAAGGNWLEFLNPTTGQIGEFKELGATTLAPSASFDLGTVFSPVAARDLTFEFLQAGQQTATLGAVIYEAISTADADFDNDNDVDGNDFLRWQRGVGLTTGASNAQGDANGDGAVNAADLTAWRSQYGQTAAVAATSAVPEPCALALAAIGVLGRLLVVRAARGASV